MRRSHAYRRHSTRKHIAIVDIGGTRHSLGLYDSPESRQRYHQLLAEHEAQQANQRAQCRKTITAEPSISELLLAFDDYAAKRYVKHGKPTSERRLYRTAVRPLAERFPMLPVSKFGPTCLLQARTDLVAKGYCRAKINQHLTRIRNVFRWGVSRELVTNDTYQALTTIEGLRRGEARETPKVLPVAEALVYAIEPFVTPPVWAMIQFQLWTGCRPGEACVLRPCDVDQAGDVWEYRPHTHKTEHRSRERVVYIGPVAQQVLAPWLGGDPHDYAWRPMDGRRSWSNKQSKHRRAYRPCYTNIGYATAIKRGCDRAWPVPSCLNPELAAQWRKEHRWHANQLRHTAATRLRAEYGIELARIILGHQSVATSELYAEVDRAAARRAIRKSG